MPEKRRRRRSKKRKVATSTIIGFLLVTLVFSFLTYAVSTYGW
ncbi:hypothetical protein [Hymenobacter volaticus]|nr:hypothetical protein [Hymenobacter volaticus]MDF7809951.1 hypothetical protein [Hymenobacter sp. YC55]